MTAGDAQGDITRPSSWKEPSSASPGKTATVMAPCRLPKEAAMAKMQEAMKQSGKAMPGKMGNMKPMQDTTKAQFMERHGETLFTRLDKNGDGVIDEAERANVKARLGRG